jgi:polysaccharide deacetylase 2 family uncharacterized protein YibQ
MEKQLYIVIDDAGLDMMRLRPFLEFPAPLTVAIMPGCKYTTDTRDMMQNNYGDKEYILHQPMQPISESADPGKGAILDYMEPGQIPWTLDRNLAEIPGAKGMNNHMGSKITSNREMMRSVLQYCKANDLYFLDSLTTPNSVVAEVAKEVGLRYERRHVFLDNERDEDSITARYEEAARIADEKGYAIMIGHAWSPETAKVLQKVFPFAQREGYTFHVLSDLFEAGDLSKIPNAALAPAQVVIFK